MRRTIIALVVISALGLVSPVDAVQRLEISGTTCPKLGAKRTWQKSRFVCTSIGKRRVWIKLAKESAATTTTVVQTGTLGNPVQIGRGARDKDIEVFVLGSSWNAGIEVCKANFYNDGCTYDSNYNGIPDPNSKVHWVRIDLSLKNIGSKLIDVQMSYTYVVSLGGRLYGENDFVSSIDSINDVQFLPGSSVNTSFYVSVPKSVGTANLLFLMRPFGGDFTYFATQ